MIPVVAAVIEQEDRYLLARRKPGKALAGHWEFPGGKIEPGEDPADCLRREILEEMHLDIEVGDHLCTTEHTYPFATIKLIAYRARITGGEMILTDHDGICWATPDEMQALNLAPADLPVVDRLRNS